MVFIYPTVTHGSETWAYGKREAKILDTWWMRLMRRVRGVTICDRMRSAEILKDLKVSPLSELVEERQLRYLGHIQRYPDGRWVKFAMTAERPGQTKTGKKKQWVKTTASRLAKKQLNTDMMENRVTWRAKLRELYPRGAEEAAQEQPTTGSAQSN